MSAHSQAEITAMNQLSEVQDCTKMDAISDSKAIVSALIKAKKDLVMYPGTNPVVVESIEKLLRTLNRYSIIEETVELLVEKEHLLAGDTRFGENEPRVSKFSLSLYRLGIHKIIIDRNIAFDEMKALLEIINMKSEDIEEAGGIIAVAGSREITGATIEAKSELAIIDGTKISGSDNIFSGIEGLDDLEISAEQLNSPGNFSRMFARIEEGDHMSTERLRKLLRTPRAFSSVMERLAMQVEKAEGQVDLTDRVGNVLEMLKSVGTAIDSMPFEDERAKMHESLADSVLGLPEDFRANLLNQGILPNLTSKSIEANILSRFPVRRLTDALFQNFKVSGGTASVVESYFNNLEMVQTDKLKLAGMLRHALRHSGLITNEVDAVLKAEETETDDIVTAEDSAPMPEVRKPQTHGNKLKELGFTGNEKAQLANQVWRELEAPGAEIMIPALLVLFHNEESSKELKILIERADSDMDYLLTNQDYENAAELISGLNADLNEKKKSLSTEQFTPLKAVIDKYVGEQGIRHQIDVFREIAREDAKFEEIVRYFSAIGLPAINALLGLLEYEESRHVRLLICEALAQIGDKAIDTVAERVNHSTWHVVRNAVSILGQIGAPECVIHLKKAVLHEEFRVRKEAMKSLASIKTREAVEGICVCLKSKDIETRMAALGWVSALGAKQAMPMVEQLLGGNRIWKTDDTVLRLAIQALGGIGTEPATDLLLRLTRRRSLFRRRKKALIKKTAIEELRKVGKIQRS
jgi:HEAT repeat protein